MVRRIGMVRKRDGRLVPFDARKIADAIYKAALSVGGEDRFLAQELSDVVTVFLEKDPDLTVPTIEQIQDMVEKVLIETGHARTAKAFILYREERRRVRRARASRDGIEFGDAADGPHVQDLPRESVEPRRQDDRVAVLADAERSRRGRIDDRRGVFGLPREQVLELLRPGDGRRVRRPADAAGRMLLRSFALTDIHAPAVAAAHAEGRIHIHGLGAPAGLAGASVNPDVLKVHGRLRPGASPATAAVALGRALARTARAVDCRFAADDVNVTLAPLVMGLPTVRVEEVLSLFLTALDGRVEVNLVTEMPTLLAVQPARGVTGEVLPLRYGELAREARVLLEAALDLWAAGENSDVPAMTVHLGPRALAETDLVDRVCAASLEGRPITLVRMRDGLAAAGSSVMRRIDLLECEDATAARGFAFGKVSIHLPAAAARAPAGSPTRFLVECAEAMDLAIRALRERFQFLERVGATPGAPLETVLRGDRTNGGVGALDLSRAVGIVGLAGLNEAVEGCLGRELHEEDEALKLGERVAAFFRLQVQEERQEGDPEIVVSESFEPEALERLRGSAPRLTAGARMRPGAPIDLVTRIEREGRFHSVLRSATVSALFRRGEPVPAASAAALVRKTFENTAAEGLTLGREAG